MIVPPLIAAPIPTIVFAIAVFPPIATTVGSPAPPVANKYPISPNPIIVPAIISGKFSLNTCSAVIGPFSFGLSPLIYACVPIGSHLSNWRNCSSHILLISLRYAIWVSSHEGNRIQHL